MTSDEISSDARSGMEEGRRRSGPLDPCSPQSSAGSPIFHTSRPPPISFAMPKVKSRRRATPAGWEVVESTLDSFERRMRDAESESHEGKRQTESVWPIFRIHHQRSRYIYEMFYVKHEVSLIDISGIRCSEWCATMVSTIASFMFHQNRTHTTTASTIPTHRRTTRVGASCCCCFVGIGVHSFAHLTHFPSPRAFYHVLLRVRRLAARCMTTACRRGMQMGT
jgi:hypothetical protein